MHFTIKSFIAVKFCNEFSSFLLYILTNIEKFYILSHVEYRRSYMKKLVILLGALMLLSTQTFAVSDSLFVETNVSMKNYWEKTNKLNQKVMLRLCIT